MIATRSPEQLMHLAEAGSLSKLELADLLAPDPRHAFLNACAGIEDAITARCTARGEHCLESGCALEGEACLEALLTAEPAYRKACGGAWLPLFADPGNRIDG